MTTLIEVVLAFVVTSALLIALIHLLLPAKRS
jgi:Tfp pilus assembly protein PilV